MYRTIRIHCRWREKFKSHEPVVRVSIRRARLALPFVLLLLLYYTIRTTSVLCPTSVHNAYVQTPRIVVVAHGRQKGTTTLAGTQWTVFCHFFCLRLTISLRLQNVTGILLIF